MTETETRLPIHPCVVAMDETQYWCLDPKDMALIERIEGVYVYDRNVHTYCCEMTPSYWLELVENRAVFKDGVSESDVDRIDTFVSDCGDTYGHYFHTHTIDALAERLVKEAFRFKDLGDWNEVPFDEVGYDDQWDAVLEHLRCNAVV